MCKVVSLLAWFGVSHFYPPRCVQRAQQAVLRLQALNPNVAVSADTESVEGKSDDYLKQFDVVCATCCTTETLVSLNTAGSFSTHLTTAFPVAKVKPPLSRKQHKILLWGCLGLLWLLLL